MPLQGVWTADAGSLPPWKGDYLNDLYTQMTYMGYQASGRLDEGRVFLDFMHGLLPAFRKFAREFLETPGAAVVEVSFLCCAHLGVPQTWHPIFVLRVRRRRAEVEAEVAFFRAYGSPVIMAPNIFFAFLRCAHMGVPRSWHPIFFAFLRCAHMGVPLMVRTLFFVAKKETRSGLEE